MIAIICFVIFFYYLVIYSIYTVSCRTHVWGQFCLCYDGQKLVLETDYLRNYGIKDGDQVRYFCVFHTYCRAVWSAEAHNDGILWRITIYHTLDCSKFCAPMTLPLTIYCPLIFSFFVAWHFSFSFFYTDVMEKSICKYEKIADGRNLHWQFLYMFLCVIFERLSN